MAQKCTIDQIKDVLSDLQYQLDAIKEFKKDTVVDLQSELDATSQPKKANEEPVEEKRPSSSLWGRVKKRFKAKKESSTYASDSGEGSSRKSKRNVRQDEEDAKLEISKLQNDIRQMKAAFEKLAQFQSNISKSLEIEVPSNKLRAILLKTDSVKSRARARDLKEIRRKVLNLKGQIPSLLKKQSSIGLSVTDSQTAEENGQIVETGIDILLPGLHVSNDFKDSSAFEEVVEAFETLEFTDMLCLLSFAVFPENKEVKRTMLMYWWIGEGFISNEEDSENKVTKILDEFSRKGLVEPVEDERKLKPSGYKMEPHVHATVVYLASRMGLFDLYSEGKLKMKRSEGNNVCLVKKSSLQQEAKASKMQQLKDLNSVFNSSERYPDFTFKWFPQMGSLKVLYLGRWERTATRHIEVESTDFLKDIKALKSLRLASFQGISRIENLKDLTCSLPNLVILDLRACYNLEGLPEDIGSLDNLVYLDVSECYMLDRMPGGISDLKSLQVLKGFVISQSDNEKECAVKYLVKLRKLSITVNRYQFKVDGFMESLKDLKQLESLKIAWGARFSDEEGVKGGKMEETDKEKNQKHKDSKEGEDDQAHKKGQASEEKNNEDGNKKAKREVEEEGKKRHEVNAESLKPDERDKGNAAQEEGKKQDKVDAEKPRSEEDGVEGVKKASPSSESTNNKKTDDKQEERRDGEKEKVNPEEGKKKDEVKEATSKPEDEKTSPPQEAKETVKSKPDDDHQRGDKQEGKKTGEKDKTEGEKKDDLKAENSEPGKVDKKTGRPQESSETVNSKPDDHKRGDKQEEKIDGEKHETEGEKKDELKAENSEPGKVDKKTSPPQESKDTVTSKPDEHQRGDIQEEKRDGEKDIIEEGNKKHDSKPDNLDEEKKSPTQQSKDSKADDHKENSKDGEKIKAALKKPDEEGEAKKNKLYKKVSFSEEPRAPVQKKPAATKESGSRITKLFTMTRTQTKKLGKGPRHENSGIDTTSKLPSSLKKLELECYPEKEPPVWLNPKTLDNLTKLSIKGGNLTRFSDEPLTAENKCGVQILRLKYLHEFKAKWKDLQALFPQLKLLEKYKCPEVAFCPTDGNGVWTSQP